MIAMTKVTYYKAIWKGIERGISLDRESLSRLLQIKLESKHCRVEACTELVGQIDGLVEDWGHCKKVHFTCPSCRNHQWGDPCNLLSGKELWYSECSCVVHWLVSWSLP